MLPPALKEEAKDFIEYLLAKTKKNSKESEPEKTFGSLKGKISLSEDFDEPLDDFKDYM